MRLRKENETDTNARLLSIAEASAYLGLGASSSRTWLDSIGAKRKFGARTVYDRFIIDKALDALEGSEVSNQ